MQRTLRSLLATTALCPLAAPAQAQCQLERLAAPGVLPEDRFAEAVALDGDVLAVGARGSSQFTGEVHVFVRGPLGFAPIQVLTASDPSVADSFGRALALEGDTLLVGAPAGDGAFTRTGAAYVFRRTATGFVETQKLFAADGQSLDLFGEAVALSGDSALIGAFQDDDPTLPNGGLHAGSAYVFRRSGSTFAEVAKLTPSDASTADEFGLAVALSGTTAVVGAHNGGPSGPLGGPSAVGAAYVFEEQGGVWVETQKLTASDGDALDELGLAVAVEGDAILAGARGDDAFTGAAYVFRRQAGVWIETQKLVASDPAIGSQFGFTVALEGRTALVTSLRNAVPGALAGVAYVLESQGGAFFQTARLEPSDSPALGFGHAAALDRGAVLVGAFASSAAYRFKVPEDEPLFACPELVSAASGGAQAFRLDAGPAHAGGLYLLLGSLGGTTPGQTVGPFTLPLNAGPYFDFTLLHPNTAPLSGSFGLLDADGRAEAALTLPAGAPLPVGLTAHHAYVAIDLFGSGKVALASNAERVVFGP